MASQGDQNTRWYASDANAVLAELGSSREGVSGQEAATRRRETPIGGVPQANG